ncbi:Reticulon [Arabidopsis thaliana x Arabidopsis arenosa]|uniref:Reticulon n=1 Tax=Arabidopsis thaliana x Arabidopsis arenosa TaxID=1240361 RepID=A0A8T2BZ57_9BRAS|nr:Reticulon [Arabidopsis thaliana x Arabidopsis arenosa]
MSEQTKVPGKFVREEMGEMGKAIGLLLSGTLVYHHCANRNATLLSLLSDVLIVLLSSLAILGLLFRQLNVSVPVDPLEWQISQDTACNIVARLANTVGAAESVLRVAATGHDKRLFVKVVICLYFLAALGRIISGVTIAYAGLCLFCLSMLFQSSTGNTVLNRRNGEILD